MPPPYTKPPRGSHRVNSFSSRTLICWLFSILALVAAIPANAVAQLNSEEQAIANLLTSASGQKRKNMVLDPILSKVARERAADMANRNYFSHTNPDGHGANYLVRKAGYGLPSFYPSDGNNLESIAAGTTSPSATWSAWMDSSGHKQHLLAEIPFYADQTSYGVGYYKAPGSTYIHYWVVLTAPPNANAQPPPTPPPVAAVIGILTPTANAALTTPAIAITGTTSGTKPASSVRYRVENSAGIGEFKTATGTTAWSGSLALAPGANTIRVRSLDSAGAVLAEKTREVRYVVLRDLTVSSVGEGTLAPAAFSGTTLREVGRKYTVTAAPAAGWLFDGWSGSAQSSATALTFTMEEGLQLVANFIPNPYLAHTGGYNGLVSGGGMTGFLKVTMTGGGRFTGALRIGSQRYNLSGRFDHGGNASLTIRRGNLAPLVVTLHADLVGETQQITGSVSDGESTADISADRARQPDEGDSADAGRYTVSLPADVENPDASQPHGHGYALLSVSKKGVATLTGKLADGQLFTKSATISKDGSLPIFAPLYGTGFVAGIVSFRDSGVSDLDGTIHWSKPERPLDRFQKAAIEHDNPVLGSRYAPPAAATRVITAPDSEENVRLAFGDGDFEASVDQPATLQTNNRIVMPAPQIAGLSVTINPANGRYTGTFTHPVSGAMRRFNGVIFQKQNAGFGYFLGVEESGFSALGAAQ